jgi:hypothetical protein
MSPYFETKPYDENLNVRTYENFFHASSYYSPNILEKLSISTVLGPKRHLIAFFKGHPLWQANPH